MNFIIEYDHEKFLRLCCEERNLYMIENTVVECIRVVYSPEDTPTSGKDNVVPWFWSHGAMPLLIRIERDFKIYFPKGETAQFCGATANVEITINEFSKIIQQKLVSTMMAKDLFNPDEI